MPPAKTTLQPVDDNIQRGSATPGTKMRLLKSELESKESENEVLRGNINDLTKVLSKLDFAKESAAASVAPKDEKKKKNKDKKAPVVPAKTAYKFFCEGHKKQDNMQQVWKDCAPALRKKYQDLAKADKERYNMEMEAHNEVERALENYYQKQKQDAAMAFYEAHLEAQVALGKAQNETGKKKKVAKDPDAPKRCISSYMFFAQEMRPKVMEKNPDMKVTDVSKELGEMWSKLDKTKGGKTGGKKYEDMAAADRERYAHEKAAYDAKVAVRKEEEKLEAAARLEQDKKEAMELMEAESVQVKQISLPVNGENVSVLTEESKQSKKKKKDPNAPKRALSAYNYFMKDNRDSIKAKLGKDAKNQELLTAIGAEWKILSEARKDTYNKQAAKDQERYVKEMEAYNKTKN